mmetsp:Transcript_19067/g.41263  ORF Transcript_19067/g.41263 Transcript_19067/m.41263 type:complete len:88 (+) Transcript_19067:153-416(+)
MASFPSSSTAFTHLLTFLVGVAIGKSIDADELNAYRSSNDDSIFAKLRRRMKSVVLGGVVVGLVGFVGKRALMGGGSSTTDRGVSTR